MDILNSPNTIYFMQDALSFVVLNQWLSQPVIDVQPVLYDLRLVISSFAYCQALDDKFVRNLQVNDMSHFNNSINKLCLYQITGEAVKQKAAFAVLMHKALSYNPINKFVWNQLSFLYVSL